MTPAALFRQHFQIAYVVRDMHSAIARFRDSFAIPQWHIMDRIKANGPASEVRYLAMAYAKDVMIELIEANEARDSIYAHWIKDAAAGMRLHHLGFLAHSETEWSDAVEALKANGIPIAQSNTQGEFANFLYADTVSDLGHFCEYIYLKPVGLKLFASIPHN